MCKIFLWAPESDYDAKTVHCIAQKIVTFHRKDNVELILGTKQAYNHAIKNREEDGLQKAVEIYLKDHNSVLIAEKRNPQLKEKDLKKHKYTESLSPEIADYLEINRTTIERNSSLKEFDEYLFQASNREN
ncbi:hypothetical protein [Planktothrix pseudagardhii]|uniref:Uncharacterized protein n=1 Tax=Planktothrix pseudagardhii TaxID=132604 RepID=A0A9W4CU46_9CYAN|nr:hypothetical protein [Planktothrix pseudagardhii]CAD5919131.1 hypothetical protein NO713_00544 [Planktothrix pseudagardhii]